jgi:hypothetical protein
MVFTQNPKPDQARLEWLAAIWARQTGRTIVIELRPRPS